MKHSHTSAQKNYRHPLAAAFNQLFPASLFTFDSDSSGLDTGHKPRRWKSLLLVWTAIVMAWDGGATLAEQFASARAVVVRMFPSLQRPGKTYQGFVNALGLWGAMLLERLSDHLRGQMRRMDSCWRVMDILAFAVDGSRVECPRTKANEEQLKRAGR